MRWKDSMFFTRNCDDKRIDVDELVNEYIKELKKKEYLKNDNSNNEVELSFIENDDWIFDEK
jgi:hypothetical protein